MARVLISYDIEKVTGVHDFVKDEMINLGYYDCFLGTFENEKFVHTLPNTTLWHPNITPEQAIEHIKYVLRKFRTNGDDLLEKAFSTEIVDYNSYDREPRSATPTEINTIPEM